MVATCIYQAAAQSAILGIVASWYLYHVLIAIWLIALVHVFKHYSKQILS